MQRDMDAYEPQAIERKWQEVWDEADAYVTPNPADPAHDQTRKAYVLEMLPYPSGELHMGHVLNYTLGDVVSHHRRRTGWSVLRPMGYDAFGLPAENAAIRDGGHPREVTNRNIAAIRRQIKRMGWSIDWTREVGTHEPEYYRWTQWLFLKLYDMGLAYRKQAPVKWCPKDQTVLANEQVVEGRCERCGTEVETRNLEQWMFKITDYADRLLDDMALLEALRSKAFYVGALGSSRNQTKRRERLLSFDLTEADVDRLHGPVGLQIGSRTPAEIAVAIAAQLVQERRVFEDARVGGLDTPPAGSTN